jgi:hypothetical protein
MVGCDSMNNIRHFTVSLFLAGTAIFATANAQDSIERRAQFQLDQATRPPAAVPQQATVTVPPFLQSRKSTQSPNPANVAPPVQHMPIHVISIAGIEGAYEAVVRIASQRAVASAAARSLPFGWRVVGITEACVQLTRAVDGKGGKPEEELRTACFVAPAPTPTTAPSPNSSVVQGPVTQLAGPGAPLPSGPLPAGSGPFVMPVVPANTSR